MTLSSQTIFSTMIYFYKLTIAYDGTCYSGWQIQPNATSIQEHVQKALQIYLKTDYLPVVGSGRTDAGVHARNQPAHFKWGSLLDLSLLRKALNGILPIDIRVKDIQRAREGFHAQHNAISKEYHYFLHLDPVLDPFSRLYCWHIHSKIDLDLLKDAAAQFIGKHDFSAFANEAHKGSASKNAVRTIFRIDLHPVNGGLRIEFEGDGFLYAMVRNIVGTMVAVASHRRPIEDIRLIFDSKDRRLASMAAPAKGLFLVQVNYPKDHLIETQL